MQAHQSSDKLLTQLFDASRLSSDITDEVNVLVPCAGSFPSYNSFIRQLSRTAKIVRKINFVLIDPDIRELKVFKDKQRRAP